MVNHNEIIKFVAPILISPIVSILVVFTKEQFDKKKWLKSGFVNQKVNLINNYLEKLYFIKRKRDYFIECYNENKSLDVDIFLKLFDELLENILETKHLQDKLESELKGIKGFNSEKSKNYLDNLNMFLVYSRRDLRYGHIEIIDIEKEEKNFLDGGFSNIKINNEIKSVCKRAFEFRNSCIKDNLSLLDDNGYFENLYQKIISKYYNFKLN